MRTETRLWNKHFVILRPVEELLRPTGIALAEANSTIYFHSGTTRNKRFKDIFVFQYTLSGTGYFEHNGQKQKLDVGKGFFSNTTDEHTVYYYPPDAVEPWKFLYITIFDQTGCAAAVNEHFGFVFDVDPSEPQIRNLISYGEVPERTIQIDAGAAHVFANSLIGMLVDQAQCDTRKKSASLSVVKKALTVIENNIGQPLNAASLAKKVCVSPEHLNRIFREELARTPYQCICETKMQRACELLKGTDQTVANIAMQLGYDPDSHFTRLFKRVVGVTPGRYRRGASMPLHSFQTSFD
jgi:AraC-like DNA-binding protein